MMAGNERLYSALVSMIIPFYNRETTLERCLASALAQTLPQIEVICVDDGSTDASADIARKFAHADSRVVLLQSPANDGCLRARKRGVEAAAGEYIMFLDSDDTLEPNACEVLVGLAKMHGADITQGTVNITGSALGIDHAEFRGLSKLLRPYDGSLRGKEIFHAYFVDKHFGQSLVCRLYRAGLCKQGFARLSDMHLILGEDSLATASMTLLASVYTGTDTEPIYNYFYGDGVSASRKKLSLEEFQMRAESLFACNRQMQLLLESDGVISNSEVREALSSYRQSHLDSIIYWWGSALELSSRSHAFSWIAPNCSPVDLVEKLRHIYSGSEAALAEALYESEVLSVKTAHVATVGVHYSRYTIGGVERVMSELFPMWLSMGYNVVFFCDYAPQPDEYPLPPEVTRLTPPQGDARCAFIASAIREYHIDVYVENDWLQPRLLWDMLVVKLSGVPFVTYSHGTVMYDLYMINHVLCNIQTTLRLSDLVLALSACDCAFWELSGAPTVCVSNPCRALVEHRDIVSQKNTVVMVGRISPEKGLLKAIEIIQLVTREISDAKLLIVGNGIPTELAVLKNAIRQAHLEDSVILCGYQRDVEPFYRRAQVYLHASITESWAMTLFEAMSCGKPIVMFELPYLTLVQENEGVIGVPQGDCAAAANEIVRLLRDSDYRESRERASFAAAARFASHDSRREWQGIFKYCAGEEFTLFHAPRELRRYMFENLTRFFCDCCEAQRAGVAFASAPYGRVSKFRRVISFIPRSIYWTKHCYRNQGGLKGVVGLYKRKLKKYFLGIPDEMEGVL